jgi:hypothetical protein
LTSCVVPVAGAAVAVLAIASPPAGAADVDGVAVSAAGAEAESVVLFSPPPQAPRTSALAANTKALKRM